jgi:DNA-binding beta-propeller fold protein YncE
MRDPHQVDDLRSMSGSLNRMGADSTWLVAVSLTIGLAWWASRACFAAGLPSPIQIPTGQEITPTADSAATFEELKANADTDAVKRVGRAAALALSPDGRLLAILTSGSGRWYGRDMKSVAAEYVFLFDVTTATPQRLQVLTLAHTYQGLAWAPSSEQLFVSGGSDDTVIELQKSGATFSVGRTFRLGHSHCLGLDNDTGHFANLNRCGPVASGLAVAPDGRRLLAANLENDSVSLIDLGKGQVVNEQDLRPGVADPKRRGQPGGSFPRAGTWVSSDHAYVASERDREVIALRISDSHIRVTRRIALPGQPVALLANREGTRLYVALATTGRVAVVDTTRNAMIEAIDATGPPDVYRNTQILGGANTNALALLPDERLLLVSNGGENAVAVVHLSNQARGTASAALRKGSGDGDDDYADREARRAHSAVIGLVPTGWYPAGVVTSRDGRIWYIVNGKSETGPNVAWCQRVDPSNGLCTTENKLDKAPYAANGTAVLYPNEQHVTQLEKAGFLTLPAPVPLELARLTKQVAHNNHFDQPENAAADDRLFAFLREHIKHVIYIVKENRTYDQVLGDLEIGNGDRRLTLFPETISPNHHAIARGFVTLDNFLVTGEGSWEGWDWSVSAQTNDYRERMMAGGMGGEQTGFNRNLNLRHGTSQARHAEQPMSPTDPDILPGERDVTAPDGPGGEEGKGHLWDVALRQGLTVRNWGFWGENRVYGAPDFPLIREPYAQKTQVFFATRSALAPYSDPYFYDFGPNYPDFWRMKEWKREFSEFAQKGTAPHLMLVRLGNDHFGSFDTAIDGVNTPETQMADNDYALGLLLEAVAHSPFAKNTLVISVEDDAWDGPDHVDAHRSIVLFAGPYVRRRALVSTRHTTVNVVKTIEEILGIGPIGLNDALAAPMSQVFDPAMAAWTYSAVVPDILRSTQIPLPPAEHASRVVPKHPAAYWARAMKGQDFSGADRVEPVSFNRMLWRGLKGNTPYPAAR